LAPRHSVDPLKRVSTSALPPWEVVVDDTAGSWEQQRYVGHVYQIPLEEAVARFGHDESKWTSTSFTRWIESSDTVAGQSALNEEAVNQTDRWVRIFEVYDLEDDRQYIWSEDFTEGGWVFEGVKVEVGALNPDAGAEVANEEVEVEETHEKTGIPYKTASGRPVVPIIPVYLSRDPDQPLRGYSLVERSRDQFREFNVMRSYQANGVRRMARQWLVRQGFLGEEGAAKISEGLDGEMIEADLPPGQPLEDNIIPVPNAPIPADISVYAETVNNDIKEAGLLAPFTRGEVTKSTATEQQLLASYTSTELGRMARIRDAVITGMAATYNIILSVVLGDEQEPLALPNPVGPTMLSAEDLTGDFRYWAVDAGQTPMSDMVKQQSLERLSMLLVQLGAQPAEVLEELVRVYNLPERLSEPAPPPEEPGLPPEPEVTEEMPPPGGVLPLPS